MTDTPPPLPVVWRPRRTRVVAYTLAGTVMLGMIVLAVVVSPQFNLVDRIGLVLVGLAIAWLLHMFARCRVVADDQGLTVVNAFTTRRFAWPEIISVTMSEGEPWPTLDLATGDSIGAMGINGAERPQATQALKDLKALIKSHSETPDP